MARSPRTKGTGFARPAQGRPDARREFGRRERLDHVVLGAGLQRPRDGLVAPVARDEDDRQVGELGHGLHQLDAVGPGQHQVEQDQLGLLGPDEARHRPGVAGDQRGVARLRQRVAEMAQRLRVVVDHEDGHCVRGVARRAGAGRGGTVAGRLGHRDREGEARAEADAAELLSVPLLDVADIATGVRAVSSGHGASHEIRLLVEGVLSISAGDREGDGIPIAWTVGELLQALYASSKHMHRAVDRPGDWALSRRAALWVDHAAIPWRVPSGNLQSWFLMRLRTLPGERPGLDDPVVFDVRLPPGAGIGPVIDREALRAAARVSSPAYRIGIGVPSLTWIPGVTRPPMRGPGGVWTGDPRRYPVLSDRDRRRIAFGPDDDRKQAHVDDAWRKRADAAGVVILDTEAVDRDGKRGWHVVTIAAAEAIEKARRKG